MPKIVVEPVTSANEDAHLLVLSMTYNDGLPMPEDRPRGRFSTGFYASVDGEPAGSFRTLSMNATRGMGLLGCSGVQAVAVLPEHRRSGVGSAMMNWHLRDLHTQGIPLASLYAFRESFYRRFGYETCGKRLRISCPNHRLPKIASDMVVRRLSPADWSQIVDCYGRFGHLRSGVHIRTEIMWERVLNEHRPLAIYAVGDPVEGYISIRHETAFWVEQWLSEVVWTTPESYRAVIGVMAQLGINKTGIAWYEPSDSPFYAQFFDQGIDIKIERPIMFRVSHVKNALSALRPDANGEFTLRVRDSVIAENEGPWRVSCLGGQVSVDRASDASITLDANALSQALMGDPSIEDLARMGRVQVREGSALEAAARILPVSPVFCNDFF